MNIGIIGMGAIGAYVHHEALAQGHTVGAVLLRPESSKKHAEQLDCVCVDRVEQLPGNLDHVVDCAGHAALHMHGAAILRRGVALTTVSLGALADKRLLEQLEQAAHDGQTRLHLASGAIGALDCLRAARTGGLEQVIYTGRKPPLGWQGSAAETLLDRHNLNTAQTHFDGNARNAAIDYPKNANVAAAVALAGVGFEATRVKLIADPGVDENIHQLEARGAFGSFTFEIRGRALPDNPRSSALAAMSVLATLAQQSRRIVF